MDSFVNAFKRFSFATDYNRWSPAFSKLVEQLSTHRISLSQRGALLSRVGQYLCQPGFVNQDKNEMFRAKKDLLLLWEYLLEFVGIITDSRYREQGYMYIVMIMQRDEFRLSNLGFGPDSLGPTCSKDDLRLARTYKSLLIQTFILVTTAMARKGKFTEIIHFSAQTLAIFFFRLPMVGGQIIDALQAKARETGEDIKGHAVIDKNDSVLDGVVDKFEANKELNTAKASEPISRSASTSSIKDIKLTFPVLRIKREDEDQSFLMNNPDLFQWTFFNSEAEADELASQLSKGNNSCMVWLTTKETFFLTFVEMFVKHVQRVSTEPIQWSLIPAYEILLQCFWPLIRSAIWWDGICRRQPGSGNGWVTSYPAYMRVKVSALALLSNKQLLNHYILITYECTNIHSLLSVDSCVEHLNLWFSTVAYPVSKHISTSSTPDGPGSTTNKAQMRLPDCFDYNLFWFGLKKLLQSELFQVLLKVCSFLYNSFHLFRGKFRKLIVNDVLQTSFFTLFLHWSSEVRTYFQHLLVYKVLRSDRRFLPCFTDTVVLREYTKIDVTLNGNNSTQNSLMSLRKEAQINTDSVGFNERRMTVFDETNNGDDEQLLIDIAHCSKIDSYVRMCLEADESIPRDSHIYIKPALQQYAALLKKYYMGVQMNSLDSLPLL